ncbi:hypothetical protein LINGRAHAP2_LOCUS18557 [Linum grandiflorum]
MASPPVKFSTYTNFFALCATASSLAVILCAVNTDLAQKLRQTTGIASLATTVIFSALGLILNLAGPFLANFTYLGERLCTGYPPRGVPHAIGDLLLCVSGVGVSFILFYQPTRSIILLLATLHLYAVCLLRVVKAPYDFNVSRGIWLGLSLKIWTVPGVGTLFQVYVATFVSAVEFARLYFQHEIEAKWREEAAAAAAKAED